MPFPLGRNSYGSQVVGCCKLLRAIEKVSLAMGLFLATITFTVASGQISGLQLDLYGQGMPELFFPLAFGLVASVCMGLNFLARFKLRREKVVARSM